VRLLTDENFNGAILRGLVRRLPELDIVRVQDVGLIHQKTRGKPLALDMGRNSVAVSTAFNISLHN